MRYRYVLITIVVAVIPEQLRLPKGIRWIRNIIGLLASRSR